MLMILAGVPKLADNARLYEPVVEFGWPRWTYFATGLAEVGGGAACCGGEPARSAAQ